MAADGAEGAPLFSLVVPSFNSAAHVEALLRSVAMQTLRDHELVLVDGASKDDTVARVESWRERLPALVVDSRPDRGIFDAINRGLGLARGRWVLVLGSDDRLASPAVLAQVAPLLAQCTEPLVYGDVRVSGRNSMVADGQRYGGRFDLARLLGQNICQQGIFYRRELFDSLGRFDLRYRVWADWHFALRASVSVPMRWVDLVVADFSAGGMSQRETDPVFRADFKQILWSLQKLRPLSMKLPLALLKHHYWRRASSGAK